MSTVGDNGETAKQTRAAGRPSWGRKKGNGRKWRYLYDDKWTCYLAISPAGCACHSTVLLPTLSLSFSFSLRGIHMHYRGLDLPPLPRCTPHSLLSLFVSVTTCPCLLSSDIFTSAPHATAYQTSPITSSNPHLRSSDPRTSHSRILPRLPLTSPLPHLPLPLSSSVFPALPCASSRLPRLLSDQSAFRFGLPMTLVQRPIRPLRHRRTSLMPHSLSSTSITITILPALD